jgi:GAF domain-containing protein
MLVKRPDSLRTFERRRHFRQPVNTPAFASFDGITGGMILDLSERGMSMQTVAPLNPAEPHDFRIDLLQPDSAIQTTGFIAWADALGRAGVRFSDLPEDSRVKLKQWLASNSTYPSQMAPRITVFDRDHKTTRRLDRARVPLQPVATLTLVGSEDEAAGPSSTVQYDFAARISDLDSALALIVERAQAITRADGAAVGMLGGDTIVCRASSGLCAPEVGSSLGPDSRISAECVRLRRTMHCDDTETDPRVDQETCRQLGLGSFLVAPLQYESEVLGIVGVFSTRAHAFDQGDSAVVERIAQTIVASISAEKHPAMN